MNMEDLHQHLEHNNYDCVAMGLTFVGRWLEEYTKIGLQEVHQAIYKHLAGKAACSKRCNARGNRIPVSRWCTTCNDWREMLKTFHRTQCDGVKWENEDPSKWPLSYENIANVFVNALGTSAGSVNLQDLSDACSIWETCEFFNLKDAVIKDVKYCRNELFDHNDRKRFTDDDKAKVFKTLKQLINEKHVQRYINTAECLNELDRIEKGDKQTRAITEINNLIRNIYHAVQTTRALAYVISSIFLIVIGFNNSETLLGNWFNMNRGDSAYRFRQIYTACVSEAFTYPFRQDLPLLGYLPTQNELIGREWALEILEQKLLIENTNSRGVLMTADYGFGKSAIVAHLLCVGENMKGWNIRKHIVAFHVCKFNVGVTKRPARLIRRLIGFLSMKSAEYGQYITLHEHSLMFNESDCEKDIDACFDQALTIPLETLTPPDDAPWIIAIDALDECLEPDGANPILELLSNRIIFVQHTGRKWFRWMVTSRQMISLTTLRKFDIVDFKSSDERNTNDIYQLITNYFPSAHNYLQLAKSFAINSGGNILYVRLAVEHALQSKNLSLPYLLKLPVSMEEIYELNFDRLFENNDDFQTAKPILEIICIGQFKLTRISEILTENGVANQTHFEKIIDTLSFFILTDTFVTFRHKSLHDWLTNNSKYRVSIERGHAMVATYLLNSLIPEHHFDEVGYIWKLVDHVAKSEDNNLFNKFKSSHFTHFQKTEQRLNEFEGVKSFFVGQGEISKKSLELILDFMNKTIHEDIADVILKNIYVMSRDNLDTFKFLFKRVSHLKRSFLLHGAAKHCTTEEIARYLIVEANQSVLLKDMQGRRPSDIACLYGCLNVLKLIAKKDPSVMDMQCLYISLLFGKQTFNTILNEVEFHLSCNQRKNTDFQRVYFNYIHFVKEHIYKDTAIENILAIFKNSVLHGLVYSYSEFYTQKRFSEVCIIHDSFMCEKIMIILSFGYITSWPHSEGQIPSELDRSDHYFYLEKGYKHVRNSYSFKTFVNKYPKILSCPDVQGFTPALLIVVLNKYDLLPEVLGHAIKDRCQKASPVMVYIFWYITERHRCVLSTDYPHYRWCWYHRKYSCPIHASFEHLLMRYERVRMIDLVIANGYTLDWNKRDIHGKTPLDYAKPGFIRQLENHYGVNIQVLSDKERLIQSCVLDWSYFILVPYMFTGVCVVMGIYILTYYGILNVVFSVFFSFQNIRQTY